MKYIYKSSDVESVRSNQSWGNLRWLASRDLENAVDVTVGRVAILKGHSNPRHRHVTCEEVLYLLAGKLIHSVGDESCVVEHGDTLTIPAGVFHNAKSVGDCDADMIVAYSSGVRDFELEKP